MSVTSETVLTSDAASRDTAATTERLTAAGALLIAPPIETPWRSRNARLAGPGNLQLTLFQELGEPKD